MVLTAIEDMMRDGLQNVGVLFMAVLVGGAPSGPGKVASDEGVLSADRISGLVFLLAGLA